MFEGWASDLLASYLGHFLDVKKEQLRISLWSAWSTGLVLENVKLKAEAFEHLQLPFAILEGSLGRLEVQVPWRALRSRPVIVEVSAVRLVAAPRPESDWEEGPAGKRAQAAQEARLAAAELERLSKPAAHEREQRGLGWSFLSHLGTTLLNRLQLSVRDVHLCFREEDANGRLHRVFGLQLQSLHNLALDSLAMEPLAEGPPTQPAAQLTKRMDVQGFCLYWHCNGQEKRAEKEGFDLTAVGVTDIAPTDYLLQPLSCKLLLTMATGQETTEFSISARVGSLAIQLHQQQMWDILVFAECANDWAVRARYAELRPTGWISGSRQEVSWRRVWQYAISAVMLDKRRSSGWQIPSSNHGWQKRRRRYVQLYQQRLSTLRSGRILAEGKDAEELKQLEEDLDLSNILLFRSLAERALEQAHLDPADEGYDHDAGGNRRAAGWLPWGLSGLSGYLSYLPATQKLPQKLTPPSESDIQELYKELNFDPDSHMKDATGSMRISLHLDVVQGTAQVAGTNAGSAACAIASFECEGLSLEAGLQGRLPRLQGTVQSFTAFDLCSHGPGVCDIIASRWLQGSGAILGSPVVTFHMGNDDGDSDSETDARSRPVLELTLQPLQLMFAPACFTRLAALLEYSNPDSQDACLTAAINLLPTAGSRAIAKAERALGIDAGPAIKCKVLDLLLRFDSPGCDSDRILLQTGEITLQSSQRAELLPEQAANLLHVLREGQQDLQKRTSFSFADALRKVERRLLYDRWEASLDGVQLDTSSAAATATPIVAPLRVSASVHTCKLRDPTLPEVRARVSLGLVDVALSPVGLRALQAAASSASGRSQDDRAAAVIFPERALIAELDVTAPIVRVHYDDAQAAGDVSKTHFELETQVLEISVVAFNDGINCKAVIKAVQLADTSQYTLSPPPIRGLIPRLAQEIIVDTLSLRMEQNVAHGLMLSGELLGALALGFQGEVGNFILRAKPNVPPIGRFTHRNTPASSETNITLQDGCFGVATLMRIAALFIPSDKPGDDPDDESARAVPAAPGQAVSPRRAAEPLQGSAEAAMENAANTNAAEAATDDCQDGVGARPAAEDDAAGPRGNRQAVQADAPRRSTGGHTEEGAGIIGQFECLEAGGSCWQIVDAASGQGTEEFTVRETADFDANTLPEAASASLKALGEERLSSVQDDEAVTLQRGSSPDPVPLQPERATQDTRLPSSAAPAEAEAFREGCRARGEAGSAAVTADAVQPEAQTLAEVDNANKGAASEGVASPVGARETVGTCDSAAGANVAAANDWEATPVTRRGSGTGTPRMQDSAAKPVAKTDCFSIEILRCRAVSPDWQDLDWGEGLPHASAHGRPDMVVLTVPHLLLQFPVQDPAQHPKLHPVQDTTGQAGATGPASSVRDNAPPSSNASPALQPSPFALTSSQSRVIAAGSHITLQVAVFDRGRPPRPLHGASSHPFLIVPRLNVSTSLAAGQQQFTVSLPSIGLAATPQQLEMLRSVLVWGKAEMDHILGKAPIALDTTEPGTSPRPESQSASPSPARVTKSRLAGAQRTPPAAAPGGPEATAGASNAQLQGSQRHTSSFSSPAAGAQIAAESARFEAAAAAEDACSATPAAGENASANGLAATAVAREEDKGRLEEEEEDAMEAKLPWRLQGDLATLAVHLQASNGSAATLAFFCSGLSCDLGYDADGVAKGQMSMGSAVMRLLDPDASSSDSDDGQAAEGSVAARVAARLARPPRVTAHRGRLKRAASAPVPPLAGLMSRAGSSASLGSNQAPIAGPPLDSRHLEGPMGGSQFSLARSESLQIASPGLAEVVKTEAHPPHAIITNRWGSKAAAWGASASLSLQPESSLPLSRQGSSSSSQRWQPMPSIRSLGSPSQTPSIHSEASSVFHSASSKGSDLLTLGSGALSQGGASDFYDPTEDDSGSPLSSSQLETATEGSIFDPQATEEHPGMDLLLLRGRESPAGLLSPASDTSIRVQLQGAEDGGLEVSIGGILLRVNFQGSEAAVERLQECARAVVADTGKSRNKSPSEAVTETLEVKSMQLVRFKTGQLLAEAIATSLSDGDAAAPCVSVQLTVAAEIAVSNGQSRVQQFSIPQLEVLCSLIDPEQDIQDLGKSISAGMLFAWRSLSFLPASSTVSSGSRQVGESPNPAVQMQISLDRVSVWASSHRLYVLAAVLANLADLQRLINHRSQQEEVLKLPQVEDVAIAKRLDGCHLSLGCLAVVLSSDSPRDSIPLLELAFLDVSASARRAESLLLVHLEGRALANAYSSMRMGWEPVVDPWPFALQLERTTSLGEAAQPALSSGQTSLAVTSKQPLELTATLPLFKAARAAQELLQRVEAVAADPPSAEAALRAANQDAALLGVSTYVVQNATGTAIQYWLGGESRLDASPRRRLDKKTLGRDMSAELPIHVQSAGSRLSKYAGQPGTFFQEEGAPDATPGMMLSARSASVNNGHLAIARASYKQLFFRLDSQEDQCGPLSLERDLEGTCAVTVHTHRATGIPSRARVSYNIAHDRNGGCTVLLHSGVKVTNMASMPLTVGLKNALVMEPTMLGVLLPGSFLWLPVLRPEPGMLCIRPAGAGESGSSDFHWSAGVRVQPLLDQSRANAQRVARQVVCQHAYGAEPAVKFNMGVIPSVDFAGWNIVIRAPLVLQNCLPMPVHITLKARGAAAATRVTMEPRRQESLHSVDANQLDEIVMRPLGYQWSAPMSVPKLEDLPEARPANALDCIGAPGLEEFVPEREGHGSFKVTEAGEGRGTATVRLKHVLEADCGSHVLRLSCTLWVYNCTGLPIALQQSDVEEQRSLLSELIDDDVPKQWLPPFEGHAQQPSRPPSAAVSRASSRSSMQGLGQALATSRLSIDTRVHSDNVQRTDGTASRGMAESIATLPSYNTPSSWPSMQGGFPLQRRKLDLQLRASQIRSPPGRTFWSSPVHLDALGGAAVVSVPCPISGTASAVLDHKAAYVLAVTATQVAGGDGALAVHVMPRYVLHNSLDIPMHYKQQNTNIERELRANGARALHWADAGRPLRLCLRVQEAGWLWSGGVALDTPGDLFIKIRHKDRGVTMLLRVDVSTSASGALLVTLSNQAAGFAPYRLDNCTSYTLHLSQQSYNEQEDVLRPYSSLLYAWDEPALPHKLVLALPGNRRLGAFNLDKVGETATLVLRSQGDSARRMQVLVRAEGPTRVLSITDLQTHLPLPLLSAIKGESLGWEPWSGSLSLTQAAMGQVAIPPPGLELEVRLELAGIGISFVATSEEVLYARASGIDLRATSSKIRHTLEASVRSLQVDNPNQSAAYPVMLASPVVPQRLGIGIVADTLPVGGAPLRTAAFCMRAAVWRRRPAGVLCVERMEVRLAPVALEAEQQHMTGILGAVSAALEPFAAIRRPARRLDEPNLDILRGGYSSRHLQEMKVYIEHLLIGSIVVTISFLPADWNDLPRAAQRAGTRLSPGLLRLLSLVGEVEGGCIRLNQLELHHPLLGTTALQQQAYSHYMRSAMPELVKLVGSANLLGDPASLFHHLGLGIWSLLAIPTAGLVESARGQGPQRIAVGFAGGFQSLLSNTVFAFSNATVKASGAARKVLVVLGVEHSDASGVPLRQRRSIQGRDPEPARSIIAALLDGIVGIVSEPVRGADEGGVAGFLTGTYRGLVGALVRPLASLLETSVKVADSIRNVVMGPPATVPRVRPPRYVSAVDPLARYDWSEAIGRYLVAEVDGGLYATEHFLLCRQLSSEVEFAVLTQRHLLFVSWPGLRFLPSVIWAVSVEDILHVQRQDSSVHVLSLQPSVVHKHSVNPLRKHALVAPAHVPYFSATLTTKDGRDASMLSQTVKEARNASQACCLGSLITSTRASLFGVNGDSEIAECVNGRLARQILAIDYQHHIST